MNREYAQAGALFDRDSVAGCLHRHPAQVFDASRAVHDNAIAKGHAVDDEVINHAAVFVKHAAVKRATNLVEARDVISEQVL